MEIDIREHTCAKCNVTFWITGGHEERLRASHESFFCPNGHPLSYPGQSDEEKIRELRRKIDNEQKLRLDAQRALEDRIKQKSTKRKTKKS